MAITAVLVAALLAQNATQLQIRDLKVGKGTPVKFGDFVTVNYTGKFTNGKTFDTSIGKRPFPFMVGAGMVIKGWDHGFIGMKAGGKRRLTVPPALGYGAQGFPPDIPANATLIFDVELLKVQRPTIKVTKAGTGPSATFGDTVQVHYRGKFVDGTEFDSSYKRNQPFPVTLGQTPLIPGFTQGLLGMKKGEKRTVTIPYELAYGEAGKGPIPAKANLIFDLELLSLTKGSQ